MKKKSCLLVHQILIGGDRMLSFLNNYFTYDDVEDIKNSLSDNVIFNLDCNEKNVIKIIELLNSLNINIIKELIINYYYLFLNTYDEVRNMFSGISSEDVNNINYDVSYIEKFL